MKRKKALAIFKNLDDAELFRLARDKEEQKTGKKLICRLVIAADIIAHANKVRNLRIGLAFRLLKESYLKKGWPEPDWIQFQRYETTNGRDFIKTNTLLNKIIPRIKTKSEAYKVCKDFADKLSYRQKIELRNLIYNVPC